MVEYVPFCELMGSVAPLPASPGLLQAAIRRTPSTTSLPDSPFTQTASQMASRIKTAQPLCDARSVNFAEPNKLTRIANAANYRIPP